MTCGSSSKASSTFAPFRGLVDANAGCEAIPDEVSIASDSSEEQLARLHERVVVGTSPAGHTLSRPVPGLVELTTTTG